MKIVLLERNSAGTDVPVDCFFELGEVTSYPNTVTVEEVAERAGQTWNHTFFFETLTPREKKIPEKLSEREVDL